MNSFRYDPMMRSANPNEVAAAMVRAGRRLVVLHGINNDKTCTCRLPACRSPGKHPVTPQFRNGVHDATTDLKLIERLFEEQPRYNLAITLEGLTVFDTDSPEGEDAVKSLKIPPTLQTATFRGFHRYLEGEANNGSSFKIKGADILTGPNRYVLVHPSRHVSGAFYRMKTNEAKSAAPIPKNLNPSYSNERADELEKNTCIPEGRRNETLFRLHCSIQRWLNKKLAFKVLKLVSEESCFPPMSDEELRSIIKSSNRYKENLGVTFGPPTVKKSLPMEFLLYPLIPRHGVTVVAGDPGRGKSLFVSKLIGELTSGRNSLPDMEKGEKKVILLSAEDSWARVTLKRLEQNNFNIENLHTMNKFNPLSEICMQALEEHVKLWNPDLIIIDTLSAYMGGALDMHRQNEVGEFLARLNEIAETYGCAILGLGHLNKSSTEHPLYRIVGSIGFAATVRSALFLGTNPENRNQLALAHGKANGTPIGRTMIFDKVGGGRDQPPQLVFVGHNDATEEQVCKIEKGPPGRGRSESDATTEFVLGFLTGEPIPWEMVEREAEARSIGSIGTLNRVRSELAKEGRIKQVGNAKASKWALNKPPADETCE